MMWYLACYVVQFAIIFGLINGAGRAVDTQFGKKPERLDAGEWILVIIFSAVPIVGIVSTLLGSAITGHIRFSWRNG